MARFPMNQVTTVGLAPDAAQYTQPDGSQPTGAISPTQAQTLAPHLGSQNDNPGPAAGPSRPVQGNQQSPGGPAPAGQGPVPLVGVGRPLGRGRGR